MVLWSAGRVGWLVHSCPQWPAPVKQDGPIVLPEIKKGQCYQAQSFLFVVLPRDKLDTVLLQVTHMKVCLVACPSAICSALARGLRSAG